MMRRTASIFTITLLTALSSAAFAADKTQTLRIISNDEDVGYVKATTTGLETTVDYFVDDNGRGPKSTSDIIVDEMGIPVSWSVKGSSLMGGDVDEWFTLENSEANWKSQADTGHITVKTPALYALNDGTPWDNYVYAKALLADDDQSMPLLPSGSLNLSEISQESLDMDGRKVEFTIYKIAGADSDGTLIAIDAEGDFFAQLSVSGVTIKAGYEALAPEMMARARAIGSEHMAKLAAGLKHEFNNGFAVANVRIFDPRVRAIAAPSTIYVLDNKISKIEPYEIGVVYPKDLPVFDGSGGTVISGLTDMHSHTSVDSGLYYLAAGVTGTRDMGNNNAFLDDLLTQIDAGKNIGPRLLARGGFIEGRSEYSARFGKVVETEAEALDAVDWYVDNGFDFIKTYNSMNPDWAEAVAQRAHARGVPITGHVPAFSTANKQIIAGYDEITHINQLMLGWLLEPNEDTRTPLRLTAMARGADLKLASDDVMNTVRLMKENDVALGTTAVILEILMLSRAGEVPAFAVDYVDHMPIAYQRYRKRSFVTLPDEEADIAYQDGFERLLETIKLLYDNDIQLLPGTDDKTGFTLQRELELYTMAGIPSADVLKMATYDIANYLGKGDVLGSVDIGKFADFVLLSGDPVQDISLIKSPRMVVSDGNVFFPAEIYQALNVIPFTTPPQTLNGVQFGQTQKDQNIKYIPMAEASADFDPTSLPFSGAVQVGEVIYFSGQIGGPRGGSDNFSDDARQVMESISKIAARSGTNMDNVFKCTVMLDDIKNWPAFNAVYKTYFTPGKMPARSAFAAEALALGATVEVECMAKAP